MKIAVIGGNGYLGCHVTKYFGADSFSRQNGFDVTSLDDLERIKDYDAIIHMGANLDKSDKFPGMVFQVNAEGTHNLVRCLDAHQTLIFTSTKEVNKLTDAYGYSKLMAEKYIEFYGLRYGIFRLATTYAPPAKGKTWINKLVDKVNNNEIVKLYSGGEQIRDFLYVNDLCRAFEMFLESKKQQELYDIGGGSNNAMKILQFVNTTGKVLNKKPNIQFVEALINKKDFYITDNRKLFIQLGWKPDCSIEEGIRKIAI